MTRSSTPMPVEGGARSRKGLFETLLGCILSLVFTAYLTFVGVHDGPQVTYYPFAFWVALFFCVPLAIRTLVQLLRPRTS